MTIRSSLLAVGLAGLVASAWLFVEHAFARSRPLPQTQKAVKPLEEEKDKEDGKLDVIYYGVGSCNNKGCHGGDRPKVWFKDRNGKQRDLIVQGNEAATFEMHDKHGDAYNVLLGELGQRMAKNLGYDVTDPKGEGATCLACHAVVVSDENVRKESEKIGYRIEDGVGCAACHGPHSDWVAAHATMVTARHFRTLTPKQKEKQYGLIDLRDPVRRTELCASCHVGSHKEKKFVTHEMYAAGHPPLPGFEVATFSNEEPRHWELLRDKTPALQKELMLREGEQEETLLMLLGGVIAFRDTMTLLGEQAKEAQKKKDVLDVANFDCYSCHHPIEGNKKKNWRQTPDWTKGKQLGKVRVRDWSMQLIRLSAGYLELKNNEKGLKQEVEKGLEELNKAFGANVSSKNLEGIAAAAGKLEKLSGDMARRINDQYPTKKDLPKILAMIPELYGKELLNYDSAREVAWAAAIVYNELYDRKKTADLQALDTAVKLGLPKGRKNTIAQAVSENMKAVEKYDPREFKKLLEGWTLR